MRAYVLKDASLSRHAGRFVWLAVDEENAGNDAFRKRFPVPVLPTFLVIDPTGTSARLRWPGGLTVAQLHALLDDVERGGGAPPALITRLAAADSLFGADAWAASVPAYQGVLDAAPAGWRGRSRVIESLEFSLGQVEDNAGAIALARRELPALGVSLPAMNVAGSALSAAVALPDSAPAKAESIREFEALVRRLVQDTSFAAAADDRSGAWIGLHDARDAAHDSVGSREVAREWSNYLDGQAARARTPDERAVFDSHRLSAYIELGEPERAVPMLQQSERDLPRDYNPPARLATAYRAMKRWNDALAASDRAMALAYGPRRLLIVDTRAEIYRGKGDLAGVRRTLQDGIAYGEALPESQRPTGRIAGLRKKLDALPTP